VLDNDARGDDKRVTLRIDITGLPPERLRFAVSPLAELTAMLHVLAVPDHHPHMAHWAAGVRATMRPELAERLAEADFLWRSSRADFLLPSRPRATLAEELDDVDDIDDERYVRSALATTCGSNRIHFADQSPLVDSVARDRVLDQAQARGTLQEAFAERLLADPAGVRKRVREMLEFCADAFFDRLWPRIAAQLAADQRLRTDIVQRQGVAAALASISDAVALAADGNSILIDKLMDNATSARGAGVTLIPSVYGHPHLVTVHTPGWHPLVQYTIAQGSLAEPVLLQLVTSRLDALVHPVRMRLVRTLARGPHTTGELARAWELTPPEVSRHLAVLRRAGLLTAERRGRYVQYTLDLSVVRALGTDLLAALLR
jgi:DNA-binding transcriptional ArsR family regulator